MLSRARRLTNQRQVQHLVRTIRRMGSNAKDIQKAKETVQSTTNNMKSAMKAETVSPPKPSPNAATPGQKLQPKAKIQSKGGLGAGTKVVLSTVIGIPVVLLAGMKVSDDFFRRCESEYPRAVRFVRKYIPLGWPAEKKEVSTLHMSSKELEEEVAQILKEVESEVDVCEEEEEEAVDFDINHALFVLVAAREMMEKEFAKQGECMEEESNESNECEEEELEEELEEEKLEELKEEPEEEFEPEFPVEELEPEEPEEELEPVEPVEPVEPEIAEPKQIEIISEAEETEPSEEWHIFNPKPPIIEENIEETITEPTPSVDVDVLATVEDTVMREISDVTTTLMDTVKSCSNDELVSRIIALEKQLRVSSIDESRRMYELLKEQQIAFENETAEEVLRLKQQLEEEKDQALKELIEKEREYILSRYEAGVEKMHSLYEASLEEYDLDEADEFVDKLNTMKQRVEDEWRVLTEEKVAGVVETYSEERMQRMEEVKKLHSEIKHLASQFHTQQSVLEELYKNQEFQKTFISLQHHVMNGTPFHEDLQHLREIGHDDLILLHILSRIPTNIEENGLPFATHYYREFHALHKEARVAAKVPENAGFAGQLLGRTVVALVGNEGMKEDDPLVQLELVNKLLLEGKLHEAYEVASKIEGGAHTVLEGWLNEMKERVEFDKVMAQLKIHTGRND